MVKWKQDTLCKQYKYIVKRRDSALINCHNNQLVVGGQVLGRGKKRRKIKMSPVAV